MRPKLCALQLGVAGGGAGRGHSGADIQQPRLHRLQLTGRGRERSRARRGRGVSKGRERRASVPGRAEHSSTASSAGRTCDARSASTDWTCSRASPTMELTCGRPWHRRTWARQLCSAALMFLLEAAPPAAEEPAAAAPPSSTHLVHVPQRSKHGVVLGPPLARVEAGGAAVARLGVDLHTAGGGRRRCGERRQRRRVGKRRQVSPRLQSACMHDSGSHYGRRRGPGGQQARVAVSGWARGALHSRCCTCVEICSTTQRTGCHPIARRRSEDNVGRDCQSPEPPTNASGAAKEHM